MVERKATGDPAETFNELLGRAVQHGYARLLVQCSSPRASDHAVEL